MQPGGPVLLIEGVPVETLSDLYRQRWDAGEASVKIRYTLLRDDDVVTPGSPAAVDMLFSTCQNITSPP